jgi:hypothetical protein
VPQIDAFTASEQTAIAQLAVAYCSELVVNTSYRHALFGTTLDASLGSLATFFSNSGNRALVVTPLVNAVIGTTADPVWASAAQSELDSLLGQIPALNGSATVSTATQAACEAILGSAALTLK